MELLERDPRQFGYLLVQRRIKGRTVSVESPSAS
jgi:hypothetical protein